MERNRRRRKGSRLNKGVDSASDTWAHHIAMDSTLPLPEPLGYIFGHSESFFLFRGSNRTVIITPKFEYCSPT